MYGSYGYEYSAVCIFCSSVGYVRVIFLTNVSKANSGGKTERKEDLHEFQLRHLGDQR